MLLSLILILLKMENPFEIILEKLDAIQKELEQIKLQVLMGKDYFLELKLANC